MSQPHPLLELLRDDPRYRLEAYQFVRDALAYAQDVLNLSADNPAEASDPKEWQPEPAAADEDDDEHDETASPSHLTGQQLCEAIRRYALEQYGLMAKMVLNSWGLHSTSDVGNVVYNLIEIGLMKKSPTDRREDFNGVYDFDMALLQDFKITRPAK
jgi:uncharacterized repeat protein (TIGR04138 family)